VATTTDPKPGDPVDGTASDATMAHGRAIVAGQPVRYVVGGSGTPVLFLHSWALDRRALDGPLSVLTERGCRVIAPSLPGFGGTRALPYAQRTVAGYAGWVDAFLDAIGCDRPVIVIGHSFGAGVATKFAHDHVERVSSLVVLNSIGDPTAMLRPRLRSLPFALPRPGRIVAFGRLNLIAVENIVRNPVAVLDAARIALTADLRDEMAALADSEIPTLVLWSDDDAVTPTASFESFCAAFNTDGHMVRGGHSWLFTEPKAFAEVLDNVVELQDAVDREPESSPVELISEFLERTTMPKHAIRQLLSNVSPLWTLSEEPAVLAADLALCHPKLGEGDVRAVVRPLEGSGRYRLTVVAHDRPGLLGDTAEILAAEELWVDGASVMTWPKRRLALHALTVEADGQLDEADWERIGEQLKTVAGGARGAPPFTPSGRARVTVTGAGTGGTVIRVRAPDQLGLLAATCRWIADQGATIQSAHIATRGGKVDDVFVIDGDLDTTVLERHLSEQRNAPPLVKALRPHSAS
jgi:pimeloyl-ACP methyl ester carboxylesterase